MGLVFTLIPFPVIQIMKDIINNCLPSLTKITPVQSAGSLGDKLRKTPAGLAVFKPLLKAVSFGTGERAGKVSYNSTRRR
jgi:hypothetical protein